LEPPRRAPVVLYILRLRRRPVAVVFSPIWQRVLGERESSRLFLAAQALALAALAAGAARLLALALGDPRLAARSAEARHIGRAARHQRVDAGDGRAEGRIALPRQGRGAAPGGLGPSDRMLIAQMDASVTPLSTMTDDVAELGCGVERVRPSDTRADLGRALSFALDSLNGRTPPEIIVVSDGAFRRKRAATRPRWRRGTRASCRSAAAVTTWPSRAFSVRRYPLDRARYEVMLEVLNTNDTPADVELSLLGDGQVAETTRLVPRCGGAPGAVLCKPGGRRSHAGSVALRSPRARRAGA
jgi:hypothetical protein